MQHTDEHDCVMIKNDTITDMPDVVVMLILSYTQSDEVFMRRSAASSALFVSPGLKRYGVKVC